MPNSPKESSLEAENAALRDLLLQAEIDAARLLAQAGIGATENEAAKRLQRLLLEELHHRVKNTLATVIAIASQSLRNAENLEQGRLAVENRLVALGRAHDLLLQVNWASARLTDVIRAAIEPYDSRRPAGSWCTIPISRSARGRCCRSPCRSTSCAPMRSNTARCPTRPGVSRLHRGSMKKPAVRPDLDRAGRAGGAAADPARLRDAPHHPPRRPAHWSCATQLRAGRDFVYELDVPLAALHAPRPD